MRRDFQAKMYGFFREQFSEYENEHPQDQYEYDYETATRRVEWLAVENLRTKRKGNIPSTHVVTRKDKIRSKVCVFTVALINFYSLFQQKCAKLHKQNTDNVMYDPINKIKCITSK